MQSQTPLDSAKFETMQSQTLLNLQLCKFRLLLNLCRVRLGQNLKLNQITTLNRIPLGKILQILVLNIGVEEEDI